MSWKFVKKKKKYNPRPGNQPNYKPDFSDRVGFQVAKPDLYQVGFWVIVNLTRSDLISVLVMWDRTVVS